MTQFDAYTPRTTMIKHKVELVAQGSADDAPPQIGHNKPPEQIIFDRITDLYEEAKNWADGTPISTPEMLVMVQTLDKQIAEAAAEAETLRKAEKDPHDVAAKAVQDKFNPYIQKDKGTAAKARAALKVVASAYAKKLLVEQEAAAKALREAAEKAQADAREAMKASAGDLDAREDAEELEKEAKALQREATRANKDAGKGLGLRTVTKVSIANELEALTWCFQKDPETFVDLALTMAREHATRMNTTTIPGFTITKEKE